MWNRLELNQRHVDFQSTALPLSYDSVIAYREGFEPPSRWLTASRFTNYSTTDTLGVIVWSYLPMTTRISVLAWALYSQSRLHCNSHQNVSGSNSLHVVTHGYVLPQQNVRNSFLCKLRLARLFHFNQVLQQSTLMDVRTMWIAVQHDCGEWGIRTLGAGYPARQFSKLLVSATHPTLRVAIIKTCAT